MTSGPEEYWQRRYPKRRTVHGGIQTANRRGAFGKTWWGRALVQAVEDVADQGRMSRGRNYARAGQVVTLNIEPGVARGEVQGSQPHPFTALFGLRVFDDDRVAELVEQVRRSPGMLAEIASGALPPALGPLLLPAAAGEFEFSCTCPDDGEPCKHVAAVAYLTAERLDERPFDMLTLRGVDLDSLIQGVENAAPSETDDLYGDNSPLPELPLVEIRPAIDDLDPIPLRAALRLATADERVVAAALRELQTLYHTLTQR